MKKSVSQSFKKASHTLSYCKNYVSETIKYTGSQEKAMLKTDSMFQNKSLLEI